ncbi:MAG TPA: hypothetical protein VHQ47_20830 [Phycisphaerae bacterium]|jgi:hypothetical protein|nr:hypothetical protein [Phycisphaerae bacterium]
MSEREDPDPGPPQHLESEARALGMSVAKIVYLGDDEDLDRSFYAMFARIPTLGEYVVPAAGAAKVVVVSVYWNMITICGSHAGVPTLCVRE